MTYKDHSSSWFDTSQHYNNYLTRHSDNQPFPKTSYMQLFVKVALQVGSGETVFLLFYTDNATAYLRFDLWPILCTVKDLFIYLFIYLFSYLL